MKKLIIPFLIIVALVSILMSLPETQDVPFNDHVIKMIETYERDGSLPYKWVGGYEGVTQDLEYQGEVIARANADSSHSSYCCGLTFEIYYRSMEQLMKDLKMKENLNGMTAEDFEDFIARWFVQEKNGDGPGLALEAYGLGKSIKKMKDVQKGDFVQIWRTSGSGHSVIFIEWVTNENGDTTGLTYWSTQPGTNGVNYNTEYFSGYGGKVDTSVTHYSRAFLPKEFIKTK